MAQHDRPLQERAVRGIDGAICECPEPGGDAVDGGALAVETVDDRSRRPHAVTNTWIKGHGFAFAGGANHGVDTSARRRRQ